MSIQIRPICADQVGDFQLATTVPFLFDATPESTQNFKDLFDDKRLRGAFDGDQIVGTIGAHTFQMVVPGGVLPMAGTSVVSVLPTHRRQGVMRTMMTEHLVEIHDRGEPLAGLWASESSIYGRFGYGPACEMAEMKIGKSFAKLREPVDLRGTMRLVDRDEAEAVFPGIFERVATARPGMYLRSKHWWTHRIFSDPEFKRRGASSHRRVLHVRDGQPVGYAIFRTQAMDDGATLYLVELIAIDAESERALWEFLFGVDLITSIEYWNLPVDSPVVWWLEQPRKMERKIEDALWLRLVDVVACLTGRRYSASGSFVFRMHDDLCPWNEGVFRLEADDDGVGHCEPSTTSADIELTPFALGSAFLGGHRFRDLAHAGVLSGSPEALRQADALFTWDPRPWCQEVF